MELISINHKAVISFDSWTKLWTVSLLKRGGPTIIHEDEEEAKSEFTKALKLCVAVRNLAFFDNYNIMEKKTRGLAEPFQDNIEFLELSTA